MKETSEKLLGQKEIDDAMMNFVSRQAQEAILDPNLPEAYKDEVLNAAVGTIFRIAERRSTYDAKQKESQPSKQSHSIYQSK
jgi:hypothetical protein